MSAIQLRYRIDGDGPEALKRLRQRAADPSPLMAEVAEILLGASERAFEAEASPETGAGWSPLHPRTIARREKEGHWPGKILQVSGGAGLAGSVQSDHGRDFAEAGTNKVYAATHQFGRADANIDPRPFLGIGRQDEDEIRDAVRDFLSGPLGGAVR